MCDENGPCEKVQHAWENANRLATSLLMGVAVAGYSPVEVWMALAIIHGTMRAIDAEYDSERQLRFFNDLSDDEKRHQQEDSGEFPPSLHTPGHA